MNVCVGTSASPEPRIRLVFSSASSGSQTDSSGSAGHSLLRRQSSDTEASSSNIQSNERFLEVASSEDDSEKKSDAEATLEEKSAEDDSSSEIQSGVPNGNDHDAFLGAGFKENHLLMKMYGVGVHSDEEGAEGEETAGKEARTAWDARDGTVTPRGNWGRRQTHGRTASYDTIKFNAANLEKEDQRSSLSEAVSNSKVEENNDEEGVEADDEGLQDHQESRK